MLRRRILYPVTAPHAYRIYGPVRRLTLDQGALGGVSYTPPGNSCPRLPWFRTSRTPKATITLAVPPLVASPPPSEPPLGALTTTDLDGILNVEAADGAVDGRDHSVRVVAENVGVLQSTAAQCGPMRATATRRMPVLNGPTLDTRIGDIIKADESLASEMLPDVVKLLIDPNAEGVENVSLSDFAAMQPKRQLAALNRNRSWRDWLLESSHYKQVSRLALESPHYDLRALRLAGITTLYQWAEQPNLVKVSSCTRSLLDAAVEKSVEAYVDEVVKLVNTSNLLEDTLASWAADIIGKFVLDSLNVTTSHHTMQEGGVGFGGTSTGHICTLEHYHCLVKKVLASVRREFVSQRQMGSLDNGAAGAPLDAQTEAEIRERAYATLSDAMLRVLETQAQNMPAELHPLRDYGFLALERLPGLMRQSASVLQLQSIPVRHFVLHTTGERGHVGVNGGMANAYTMHQPGKMFPGSTAFGGKQSSLEVVPPTLATGVFLTGTANYNVTLGEWCGTPQPPSSPELWANNPVQNEYFSVLHRLKRHTIRVARTTLFDVIKGANRLGKGFNASEALGLQQLFGSGKLVEDRLLSVLNGYYTSSSSSKQLHFIEAGHSCGKTSVLERLSSRMAESGRTAIIVRYSGSTTPFAPGLDDHPLAFSARFWFRVALASCPYLVRIEEIFTRAPQSVMWWANRNNWSWELYQKRIRIRGHCEGAPPPLHAILVDDVDRVLDSMQHHLAQFSTSCDVSNGIVTLDAPRTGIGAGGSATGTPQATELTTPQDSKRIGANDRWDKKAGDMPQSMTAVGIAPQTRHGPPFDTDMVQAALSRVTVALGQLNMVFTGHHVSKVFLLYSDVHIRRYFIPLASSIGLQQRLRVLPLVSVLHALHQRSCLEFSGLMYEVLKNCPGLLGYTLEVFWSGRAALMDLRGGARRLMQWSGTHPLLRSYVPNELFADLPQRNYLLQNPPEARVRLVELLQRQLSSPTGYLTRDVDTTMEDERDGLTVPHNHTACQVHPFALFTIFTHQDPLESPRETAVVRAWGEVWAEYCAVVSMMGTTSERKRDALRVLLHGALLLRAVAVSGAQMDLNLKIPSYGFPLLASPTRSKQRGGNSMAAIVKATPESIRRAGAAYRSFFATTPQEHFPFRPSVGLNGGCDVVSIDGSTLALYDLVTTREALGDISYRFAEALLGVLHCIEKNVLPPNRIYQIHYVSVVSVDQTTCVQGGVAGREGSGGIFGSSTQPLVNDDMFTATPVPVVPYFLDLSAVFEDHVIDRLRALQELLGINKEFRTLNDLLDELENLHHVHVHQDVVASQAELESLLSSTLMQLVPDATVLPPYAAEVVTPEALMVDILDEGGESSVRLSEGQEAHSETVLAEEFSSGDILADGELLQESAELLDAMMNEGITADLKEGSMGVETNLQMPAPPQQNVVVDNVMHSDAYTNDSLASSAASIAQDDALAWLHDLVSPAAVAEQETSAPAPFLSQATPLSPQQHRQVASGIFPPPGADGNAKADPTSGTFDSDSGTTVKSPATSIKAGKKEREPVEGDSEGVGEEGEEREVEAEEEEKQTTSQASADAKVDGRKTRGKNKTTTTVSSSKAEQPSHQYRRYQKRNVTEKRAHQTSTSKKKASQQAVPIATAHRQKRKEKVSAKLSKQNASRMTAAAALKAIRDAKRRKK